MCSFISGGPGTGCVANASYMPSGGISDLVLAALTILVFTHARIIRVCEAHKSWVGGYHSSIRTWVL